jgi:hypothetical protein
VQCSAAGAVGALGVGVSEVLMSVLLSGQRRGWRLVLGRVELACWVGCGWFHGRVQPRGVVGWWAHTNAYMDVTHDPPPPSLHAPRRVWAL